MAGRVVFKYVTSLINLWRWSLALAAGGTAASAERGTFDHCKLNRPCNVPMRRPCVESENVVRSGAKRDTTLPGRFLPPLPAPCPLSRPVSPSPRVRLSFLYASGTKMYLSQFFKRVTEFTTYLGTAPHIHTLPVLVRHMPTLVMIAQTPL